MAQDPFAAYGGQAHAQTAADPFAAYGGSAHTAPPSQPGAFSRFMLGATGIDPMDVIHNPGKYFNENNPEFKARLAEITAAQNPENTRVEVPGAQLYRQLQRGDYAGAAGNVISTGSQLAAMAGGARVGAEPVEIPNVYDGPMPEEIPAGRPQGSSTIGHVVKQVAPLVAREVTGRIPILDRLGNTRVPTFQEYLDALHSRPTPVAGQPTYGSASNAESRGPYQPYQGDLTVTPQAQPAAPQAQEAIPSQPPTQQSGVLNRLPSQSTLSGESALRQILTGQDNANLIRIAKSRGINVTKESQLRPGVADKLLVEKIIDDMPQDELDEISDKFLENQRFSHNFGDIGPEAWKAMSIQTYFPDVKLPAAMVKRVNTAISQAKINQVPQVGDFPAQQMERIISDPTSRPQSGGIQAAIRDALSHPIEPTTNASSLEDLLRQSIEKANAAKQGR